VGNWDGADFFAQYQLCIEDNFSFAVNILDTASRVAEGVPLHIWQKNGNVAAGNAGQ
jgi:hypothetical protein